MAIRGQVFAPKKNFPPGSPQWHRVVVLSPSNLMSSSGAGLFIMVAVIYSAVKRRAVINHSIPIPANTIGTLPLDSVVETHQLFSMLATDLGALEGSLPAAIMDDVLKGARRLFT